MFLSNGFFVDPKYSVIPCDALNDSKIHCWFHSEWFTKSLDSTRITLCLVTPTLSGLSSQFQCNVIFCTMKIKSCWIFIKRHRFLYVFACCLLFLCVEPAWGGVNVFPLRSNFPIVFLSLLHSLNCMLSFLLSSLWHKKTLFSLSEEKEKTYEVIIFH